MARGINIEFLADVRRFLSGTKDAGKALGDVSDALDDLAKDAQRTGDKMGESLEDAGDGAKDAGRKIGDGIEDGTDKAEKAAKGLERKFRDIFDDVGSSTRKAGDSIGDDIKRGTDKASDGVDNFKEESRDTAREVAASFDGSAESIAGGFQEVLANAFVGFGPAGAAAGIAAAAGAGIFLAEWTKRAEDTKKVVGEMYDDMLESGQRFLSQEFINTRISELVKDDKLVDIYKEAAETIGVDLTTAIAAAAGEQEAMNEVTAAATEWQEKHSASAGSTNIAVNSLTDAVEDQNGALDSARSKHELSTAAMGVTADAAIEYQQALGGMSESLATATERIKTNNDTLAAGEARTLANNVVLADLAEELAGVSTAAAAAGVKGADLNRVQEDQYGAFMAAATAAGMTKDAAHKLAEQYELVPRNVTTTVTTTGLDAAIERADKLAQMISNIPARKTITFEGRTLGSANIVGYVPGTNKPIYGAARASGGPTEGGESYLVGEHGPEVVTMSGTGSVTPNVNVTAGGVVRLDQRSINDLARVLDGLAAKRSVAAVSDKARAGKLAGRP